MKWLMLAAHCFRVILVGYGIGYVSTKLVLWLWGIGHEP